MDNPYWMAAKYAFVISAAAAVGVAAIKGASELVNKGMTAASVLRASRSSGPDQTIGLNMDSNTNENNSSV